MHVTLPQCASSRGGAEVTLNVVMTSPTIGGHILSVSCIEHLNGCAAATYDQPEANTCMDECGKKTTGPLTYQRDYLLNTLRLGLLCGPGAAAVQQ